jgi:hypothetical protein
MVTESGANDAQSADVDWESLLRESSAPTPIDAERHLRGPIAGSFSRPHVYLGRDGHEYVVKLRRPGQMRAVASEQVVGRAGLLIGAAVGQLESIEIPKEMLPTGEDDSSAGVSHACRFLPRLTDGGVEHVDDNRARMASLTVLYTWTFASNHQLVYSHDSGSPVVYSVDHGHFLPPENSWDANSLTNHPDPVALDSWFTSSGVAEADCGEAAARLAAITPEKVARVVISAIPEWGVSDEDRLALCEYLWRRRAATLGLLGGG